MARSKTPDPADPSDPIDPLLFVNDVVAAVGRTREWLRHACRDGRFPRPAYLGRRPTWRKSVVEKFLGGLPSAPARLRA
jgi:predicted DNA-binding transcriptional regulator AlpA